MLQNTTINDKILIYGDSISRGVTFDENKHRYIFLKNSMSNNISKLLNMEVDNLSKFGNTVTKASNSFKRDIEKNNYKYVVFELGGNDCDYNWKAVAENPESSHEPNTDFLQYKNMLTELIDITRQHGATPVLATLPPIDAHKYFNWISSFSEDAKDKILNWIGNVNRIYWWQEKYNAGLLQVAQEKNCQIFDIRSAMLETNDYRDYYCIDGIHPNERGHQIMSRAVMSAIKRIEPTLLN